VRGVLAGIKCVTFKKLLAEIFYGYSKIQTESGKKFSDGEALSWTTKIKLDEPKKTCPFKGVCAYKKNDLCKVTCSFCSQSSSNCSSKQYLYGPRM
jgi:hypothetical protein